MCQIHIALHRLQVHMNRMSRYKKQHFFGVYLLHFCFIFFLVFVLIFDPWRRLFSRNIRDVFITKHCMSFPFLSNLAVFCKTRELFFLTESWNDLQNFLRAWRRVTTSCAVIKCWYRLSLLTPQIYRKVYSVQFDRNVLFNICVHQMHRWAKKIYISTASF